jgi:hypothetical protein
MPRAALITRAAGTMLMPMPQCVRRGAAVPRCAVPRSAACSTACYNVPRADAAGRRSRVRSRATRAACRLTRTAVLRCRAAVLRAAYNIAVRAVRA